MIDQKVHRDGVIIDGITSMYDVTYQLTVSLIHSSYDQCYWLV